MGRHSCHRSTAVNRLLLRPARPDRSRPHLDQLWRYPVLDLARVVISNQGAGSGLDMAVSLRAAMRRGISSGDACGGADLRSTACRFGARTRGTWHTHRGGANLRRALAVYFPKKTFEQLPRYLDCLGRFFHKVITLARKMAAAWTRLRIVLQRRFPPFDALTGNRLGAEGKEKTLVRNYRCYAMGSSRAVVPSIVPPHLPTYLLTTAISRS